MHFEQAQHAAGNGSATEREKAAAIHFIDLAEHEIGHAFRELHDKPDDTMLAAASATLTWAQTLPDSDYIVPEKSPAISAARAEAKAGVDQAVPGASHVGESAATGHEPATNTDGDGNGSAEHAGAQRESRQRMKR